MILIIDNYDSFTFNLVQRLGEIDPLLSIQVVRNDAISPSDARRMAPSHIIISPGPCTPSEAGRSCEIISALAGEVPILGVCLGHQCIAQAFGMTIARRPPVHGKTSLIHHDGNGIYVGLASPLRAARYHSLHITESSVRDGWVISAWADEQPSKVIMGIRRNWGVEGKALLEGVQFHPESFMTDAGPDILSNFLKSRCAATARS